MLSLVLLFGMSMCPVKVLVSPLLAPLMLISVFQQLFGHLKETWNIFFCWRKLLSRLGRGQNPDACPNLPTTNLYQWRVLQNDCLVKLPTVWWR